MAALNIPNTIDVNTTADAVEVEQNFSVIESWVNHDAVRRDGGVAMDAPLLLNAGDPTEDNHAANKNYVDALMPIGTIMMFGGNSAPAGDWHLCDGASLAVASYPVLYGQLGVRYGGSGGTFNLPNFAARMPIGVDASQTRFNVTGKSGGSTLVPIPEHLHDIDHNHPSFSSGTQSANHTHTINHDHGNLSTATSSAGSHTHAFDAYNNATSFSTGYPARGGGGAWTAYTTESDGAHTHAVSVNLPSYSGSSGSNSVSHTHTIDMPVSTGLNSEKTKLEIDLLLKNENGVLAAPAVKTTTEHLPPFVVVAYIIRVDPQ